MNFKPVVASLFALGLVTAPAMAATQAKETNKQAKHAKHHARHHAHHGVKAEQRSSSDYYAHYGVTDVNNAKSPVTTFDWVNRIHFSGMINVDAKYSSRGPLGIVPGFFVHDSTTELNVNNANLFVDVDVNRCVTGHIGIAYVADSVNLFDLGVNSALGVNLADSIRSDKGAVWSNGRLGVDEAYITIRDYARSPFFLRAGKMYVPFGHNSDVYPITESFTQLLSQTRATTAQVGWVSNYGLHASIFALDGARSSLNLPRDGDNDDGLNFLPYTTVENWGAQAGYCGAYDDVQYHLGASYMKDIRDVEYLAAIQDLLGSFQARDNNDGLFRRSAAAAFHGDATLGAYALSANYVTAVHNLISNHHHHNDVGDMAKQGRRDRHNDTRLSAADVTGTYNTNVMGYNTGFNLGYQRSWEAENLLPKWRIQGDVGVTVLPHTTVTVEYHYDRAYSERDHRDGGFNFDAPRQGEENEGNGHHHHGGTRSSSTAALRLGVVF